MSQPAAGPSPEQAARDRAAAQVSDVLLTIEHALARARKAHGLVKKDDVDRNAELALAEAVAELAKVRKRLTQDTYFAGDALRLI